MQNNVEKVFEIFYIFRHKKRRKDMISFTYSFSMSFFMMMP